MFFGFSLSKCFYFVFVHFLMVVISLLCMMSEGVRGDQEHAVAIGHPAVI